MPKKRSKPKELQREERVEIVQASQREETDDEEAPQPQELRVEAEHAEFLKVWTASTRDGK